jgi:hypothetical protein
MSSLIKATSIFSALVIFAGINAEPWKVDLNTNVTTALNSYSDSWVGGEAGSFTWAAQFLGVAEKQFSKTLNDKLTLKLQFGQTKVQDKESKEWAVPQKSSDLIDLEELLRFTFGGWVDPFISARVVSQFSDESDSLLVRYFNPADITEAVGMSRTLVKNKNVDWSMRLGGAARQLVERHKFDPETGERTNYDITNDGGAEFNIDIKTENTQKWLSYLGSLRVYEALVSSKAEELAGTDEENDWRYPHVKWENSLSITFAKYLMLNMSLSAFYDRDISKNFRLKEIFSAGFTYIYSNSRK